MNFNVVLDLETKLFEIDIEADEVKDIYRRIIDKFEPKVKTDPVKLLHTTQHIIKHKSIEIYWSKSNK